MSWGDIKRQWSQGWKDLLQRALDRHGDRIRSEPGRYEERAQAMVREIQQARVHLDHVKSLLPPGPRTEQEREDRLVFQQLANRYHVLAAGIYAEEEDDQVGVAPVVIVLGVALGVAGVAWALAAYEYAKNLREQTALADRELSARVQASEQGRVLQPTTLPAPQKKEGGEKLGWLLVGGLVLASGAVVVPTLLKRTRGG